MPRTLDAVDLADMRAQNELAKAWMHGYATAMIDACQATTGDDLGLDGALALARKAWSIAADACERADLKEPE
jgi:hypothetical protein